MICFNLLVYFLIISLTRANVFNMHLVQKSIVGFSSLKGTVVEDNNYRDQSPMTCALKCTSLPCICKGILITIYSYNKTKPAESRCKLVYNGRNCINASVFNEYTYYRTKGMIDIGIGVKVSPCWKAGNPKVYFSLDDIGTGIALGQNPSNIQFVSDSVVGKAFHNPLVSSYFDLGTYPSSSFCFPEPAICPNGVTFAFWLNVLGNTGDWQGFISTMLDNGPGFEVYWEPSWGFYLEIRRDQDTVTEYIEIAHATFMADFGYNSWHHYVVTYLYDGSNPGNNMEAYIDGVKRPDSEKQIMNYFHDGGNTADYSAGLQLGRQQT